VSIKSFPDYKHWLQENYVEYKYIFFFQNVTHAFIPRSFLLINVCSLGETLCSPCIYIYIYIYLFQNVFLRCPTPRLHCFLSSHWPSFRCHSFMAFLIPSIQFFIGLPRALFCFGIHFNAILGNLPSAILWTWPYHVSWFCSISFTVVSSSPICCLIVTFLILSFLNILEESMHSYNKVFLDDSLHGLVQHFSTSGLHSWRHDTVSLAIQIPTFRNS